MGGKASRDRASRRAAVAGAVLLLLAGEPCVALENRYNENPNCDPRALVRGGDRPTSVRSLRLCTRSRDLALVGNSVTRHVYFSIAHVLRAAQEGLEARGDVLAAGAAIRVDAMYRADEKRRCNPFNADHDPGAVVRGACDEALPGDGHIFAYWNTTGQLPDEALARFRAHAEARRTRLTIVVFNTLMHALSEPPGADLEALAAGVATSLAAVAAARGWAEVAWVPAPRVCAAAPGWALKHFALPDYTGDDLNRRIARHNAVVRRHLRSRAPAVLLVDAVSGMDPADADADAARRCCACYDDYVHHHRVTFNMISNLVRGLTAAGYCDDDDPPLR